ncbi:MAG: SGNH/GDSL hydrolase family protein [Actinomycetota bacterium]
MTGRHPIVDALAARPPWEPAPLTRVLTRVSGTIRSVSATIDPIERRWHELVAHNLAAADGTDRPPLWVVLGDSTAQGIGASSIDHGWVPRLHAALDDGGRPHALVNLSRSGAHSTHVIVEQLPLLDHLPYAPSIVTVCVGANDLMANPYAPHLTRRLERLAAAAPHGSILCTLPGPSFSPTAIYVNRAVRRAAAEHGHLVAELGAHMLPPHKGLSADRYHPNDRGYDAWMRAFAEPMGIDPDLVPLRGTLTTRRPDPSTPGTTASG